MAHLQSEFCTKDFFSSYEFSYEKCSDIFPEFFEPLFCGSEKIPAKFPTKFPKFPGEKSKKNHRRASAGAQGEKSSPNDFLSVVVVYALFFSAEGSPERSARSLSHSFFVVPSLSPMKCVCFGLFPWWTF